MQAGRRDAFAPFDGIGAASVSNPGAQATQIQRLTPEKVDLVTHILDIENVGDQIAL